MQDCDEQKLLSPNSMTTQSFMDDPSKWLSVGAQPRHSRLIFFFSEVRQVVERRGSAPTFKINFLFSEVRQRRHLIKIHIQLTTSSTSRPPSTYIIDVDVDININININMNISVRIVICIVMGCCLLSRRHDNVHNVAQFFSRAIFLLSLSL